MVTDALPCAEAKGNATELEQSHTAYAYHVAVSSSSLRAHQAFVSFIIQALASCLIVYTSCGSLPFFCKGIARLDSGSQMVKLCLLPGHVLAFDVLVNLIIQYDKISSADIEA